MNDSKDLFVGSFVALGILLSGVAAVAFIIVPALILDGWVISILWGWFAVETFSLPTLTIVQCIGVAFLLRYLAHSRGNKMSEVIADSVANKEQKRTKLYRDISSAYIIPIVTLGFGWIIHQFM